MFENTSAPAQHLRFHVIRLGYDWDKAKSLLAAPEHVYLRENVVTSNISSSLVRERGKNYEHAKLVALVPEVLRGSSSTACSTSAPG